MKKRSNKGLQLGRNLKILFDMNQSLVSKHKRPKSHDIKKVLKCNIK